MDYQNIKIIGTSHIAKQSIKEIKSAFLEFNPDIVCVELDDKRFQALLSDAKPDYSIGGIRKYGLQGYMFAVIGSFVQKKMGNVVGVKPGSDMLTAIKLAQKEHKQIMLVDQDIEITLRKFSKRFTWKEKFRLFFDIVRAPFSKKMKINLEEVPEDKLVEQLISQVKDRYPNLYFVLIEERNQIMAKNIYNIMEKNHDKKILVIIGAGHEKELLKLIKKEEYKRDRVR